jgi:predicted dehydrogenase
MITTPIGIAVVGFGYWGPNLARNIAERPELRLMGLCERDPERALEFARRYPGCAVTHDLDALLLDPRVQAVSIATPPRTHYELARRALEAGKHVIVEKPLATCAAEAQELIEIACAAERVLMPGHTFVYSPAVNKVRELIRSGELGDVYFVTSSRMNLGLYQPDGVISDLDISLEAPATFGEYQLTYRSGDVVVPRIEAGEPLGLELSDFARAIRTGQEPRSNCALGLEIVRALEAAHCSMERAGDPIELGEPVTACGLAGGVEPLADTALVASVAGRS